MTIPFPARVGGRLSQDDALLPFLRVAESWGWNAVSTPRTHMDENRVIRGIRFDDMSGFGVGSDNDQPPPEAA